VTIPKTYLYILSHIILANISLNARKQPKSEKWLHGRCFVAV